MIKLNDYDKEMVKHLRHLLRDNTPYERSLDGETVADAASDFIFGCEYHGVQSDALEFVRNTANITMKDLEEFYDSIVPPPEIVDSEEID